VDKEVEDSDETILDDGTGSGNEVEDGTIDGAVLETEIDCCCPEDDEVGVEGGELSSDDSSEEMRIIGISIGRSTGSGLLDGVNNGVPEPDTKGNSICESRWSGTSNDACSEFVGSLTESESSSRRVLVCDRSRLVIGDLGWLVL
jgi:hypothetical protein